MLLGAKSHGPITQANFLKGMGIVARLQALLPLVRDSDKRRDLVSGYERLVGTAGGSGMGEIY